MAYATVEQFADHMDPEPVPANARRLLETATIRIDELLVGARYSVDDDGNPMDPVDRAIFAKAVCLQAQFMKDTGDETGANANVTSMSQGGLSVGRSSGADGRTIPRYSQDAVSYLRTRGVLPVHPYTYS
ncbi:hypothetical protein ACFU9Y_04015 [Streptomyces sp. NPDC057621]|uniref:hypothetical protein n=1 Tax=Streptomyces sp. NPDC057621 TaxID=3346186 RepID=UPI0036A1FA6A